MGLSIDTVVTKYLKEEVDSITPKSIKLLKILKQVSCH